MVRRNFIAACLSLVAVGAGGLATAALAGGPIAGPGGVPSGAPNGARVGQPMALPATLGGLPRVNIERGQGLTTISYAAPGALAAINLADGTRAVADGADAASMAPTLRQLHEMTMSGARRQNVDIQVVRENRAYRLGTPGREWTWLGNTYTFVSPGGTPTRRLVLVTGAMNQVVFAMLDLATDRDIDLAPLMDELSTILAGAHGAPAPRQAAPAIKG